MVSRKRLAFIFQATTVGLSLAFLLLLWKPQLFRPQTVVQVVEDRGAAATKTDARGSGFVFSFANAVAAAAPSVVNINTQKVVERPSPFLEDPFFQRFFGEDLGAAPERRLETSLGSGVIISPQGYILTNNHVIDGADEIQVSLRDGRTARAKVVGTDPEADVAVLKVNLGKLPVAVLGQSDSLREGDVVLAIGNPFGVGQTVTQGIVSATGRNQLGINTFENYIQTDAAINPGNSGGALINARGELIGINTAIFSRTGGSQGIGFAIPVSLAKGLMEQIIERGHVSRGWLGIDIQDLTPELAESFGLGETMGVIVAGVLRGGPAEKAGLMPGDVLQKVGSQKVHNVHEALNAIAQIQPGTKVELSTVREGKSLRLRATSGERPSEPAR